MSAKKYLQKAIIWHKNNQPKIGSDEVDRTIDDMFGNNY